MGIAKTGIELTPQTGNPSTQRYSEDGYRYNRWLRWIRTIREIINPRPSSTTAVPRFTPERYVFGLFTSIKGRLAIHARESYADIYRDADDFQWWSDSMPGIL